MGQLGKIVRFCFGLQALSLIVGVPILVLGLIKVAVNMGRQQAAVQSFLMALLLALGAFLLQIVPAIAWWQLKKGMPRARVWALAASAVNLLPLPSVVRTFDIFAKVLHLPVIVVSSVIGMAGLIAFARRDLVPEVSDRNKPKPQRLPGDGTSTGTERVAGVVALVWLFVCLHWWRGWARTQDLHEADFLVWIVQLQFAILVCVLIHELGHVAAGWASHMKLWSLQVGPFQWAHKRGKWKFKLIPSLGGMTGMAPTRLDNVRGRSAFFAVGGPVASLVLGGVSSIAALTAKGHFWEGCWSILAMMATIASADFMVNLIPQKPESQYSDGARIYQMVTNGPWAHVEQAFSMVASTLVTARRPRDCDIEVFRAAGNFLVQGDRGMLLRMYSCMHYLDAGQIPDALVSLQEAERLYSGATLKSPAGTCAEFVFINAIFKRDREAAEQWWKTLQAQKNIDFDAGYWRARASILWLEGQIDEARQACERGSALARELPATGAYEYSRWCFEALSGALNEPSPALAEMLTAITSTEAPGEVEVEAPVVTDPAV